MVSIYKPTAKDYEDIEGGVGRARRFWLQPSLNFNGRVSTLLHSFVPHADRNMRLYLIAKRLL